jgi:hypothetical protein
MNLVRVWILIPGLPQYLWTDYEINKVTKKIWGVLLEIDPRCARHIDFNIHRIKIAVPRRESILRARDIMFFDAYTKDLRTYFLTSTIEQSSQVTDPWGPGKPQPYWQHKKPKLSKVNTSKALILAPPQSTIPEISNIFSVLTSTDTN